MPGVESTHVYNEVPVIQFRSLNQFIADLAAGVVDTVYHDVGEEALRYWVSCFRAVVTDGNGSHIASLSFRRAALRGYDERGIERAAEEDEQLSYQTAEHAALVEVVGGRLAETGVLALRDGLLQGPRWTAVVYARAPKTAIETVHINGEGRDG